MRDWLGAACDGIVGVALGAAIMAGAVLTVSSAAASDEKVPWKADPRRGAQLADRFCANCHFVGEPKTGATVAGIPPLKALAEKAGMTRQRVTNALIAPHAPMPDMQLTIHEIGDIIAYLEELAGRELTRGPDKKSDGKT